jgi:hypothetical protein
MQQIWLEAGKTLLEIWLEATEESIEYGIKFSE